MLNNEGQKLKIKGNKSESIIRITIKVNFVLNSFKPFLRYNFENMIHMHIAYMYVIILFAYTSKYEKEYCLTFESFPLWK